MGLEFALINLDRNGFFLPFRLLKLKELDIGFCVETGQLLVLYGV